MNTHAWQSELAVGASRSGRLLALAALAYSLLALATLAFTTAPLWSMLLWTGVVVMALPALYLGIRIEIDHALFMRLAHIPDVSPEPLSELDQALSTLHLSASSQSGRPLVTRVSGLFKLVRKLGACIALQTVLGLYAVWLR